MPSVETSEFEIVLVGDRRLVEGAVVWMLQFCLRMNNIR